MASKPKLKPCPFCGGEAQLLRISNLPNGVEEWFVSCGAASCDLYPHSTIPYASAEIAAAAWNRRAVDTPSNAAVLREALLKAIVLLKVCEWPDDAPMQDITKVMDEIEKALSAPPRNCDIYTTEDAVDTATVTLRDECDGCPRMDMEAPCVFCMVRWLLAPAKKGGAE